MRLANEEGDEKHSTCIDVTLVKRDAVHSDDDMEIISGESHRSYTLSGQNRR